MKYSEEEKALWLEDWKQSGKKAWAYAKENGLIPQTFCSWTKRGIRAKEDFVEIKPKLAALSQAARITIEKGDIKICVPPGMDSKEFRTIIKALQAAI